MFLMISLAVAASYSFARGASSVFNRVRFKNEAARLARSIESADNPPKQWFCIDLRVDMAAASGCGIRVEKCSGNVGLMPGDCIADAGIVEIVRRARVAGSTSGGYAFITIPIPAKTGLQSVFAYATLRPEPESNADRTSENEQNRIVRIVGCV